MKATVVDLRYRMNDVLKALDRNESVSVLYHGRVRGVLSPARGVSGVHVRNHPFFGMDSRSKVPVGKVIEHLRGGRHRDL